MGLEGRFSFEFHTTSKPTQHAGEGRGSRSRAATRLRRGRSALSRWPRRPCPLFWSIRDVRNPHYRRSRRAVEMCNSRRGLLDRWDGRGELGRRQVSQGAVRSNFVVVDPPLFDGQAGVRERLEPVESAGSESAGSRNPRGRVCLYVVGTRQQTAGFELRMAARPAVKTIRPPRAPCAPGFGPASRRR